ncbi:MAG: NB-ARC domain-containing protein [Planctomycetota bacterium]
MNSDFAEPMEHKRFRTDRFVGRASELAEAENSIRSKFEEGIAPPVLALRGPGGSGKTAIVAELTQRLLDADRLVEPDSKLVPGGVLWVDLNTEEPERAAARWLRGFGYNTEKRDDQECLFRFHEIASIRRPLIVLDNVQRREQVELLLVKSRLVVTLITTRDSKNLPSMVDTHIVDQLSREDALALLSVFVRSEIEAHADAASTLCEQCNFLPLFLRVSASAIRSGEYVDLPSYVAELAELGLSELADHDETAASVFDASWNQLSVDNRNMLTLLAVYPCNTFGESFGATYNKMDRRSAVRLLKQFERSSWLLRRGKRYSFHDVIRDFVFSKLKCSKEDVLQHMARCWTDWDFVEGELLALGPCDLIDQFNRLIDCNVDLVPSLSQWREFFSLRVHIFSKWPSLFFQQAFNETDENPLRKMARLRAATGTTPDQWVEWMNRPRQRGSTVCLQVIPAHGVRELRWHSDGSKVIAVCSDGTIASWDATTGATELLAKGHSTLEGHAKSAICMALTGDSSLAVTGSLDGAIRGWNLLTGKCSFVLEGHLGPVSSVEITDGDEQLVSSSWDGNLRVWNLRDHKCVRVVEVSRAKVRLSPSCLSISEDGRHAVAGMEDDSVAICDLIDGSVKTRLQGGGSAIRDIAISKEGDFAVAASLHGMVRVWDISSGQCRVLFGLNGCAQTVTLSPDASKAVSGYSDGRVCVWNPSSGACSAIFEGHASDIRSLAISPDGLRLASASNDGTVRIWRLSSHTASETGCADGGSVWSARKASPNDDDKGPWLKRHFKVAKEYKEVEQSETHQGMVHDVAISGDGQHALSGGSDGKVGVWDACNGNFVALLTGHADAVTSVAIDEEGRIAVSGSHDGTVRVWNIDNSKCISVLDGHEDSISMVAVRADGLRAASVSEFDRTVRVWDLSTNECIEIQEFSNLEIDLAARAWATVNPNAPFLSWRNYPALLPLRNGEGDIVGCFSGSFSCYERSADLRFGIAGTNRGSVHLFQWRMNNVAAS